MFDHAVILPTGLDKYQGGPNYRIIATYITPQGEYPHDEPYFYLWARKLALNLNFIDTRLLAGKEFFRPIMASIAKWERCS